MPTSPEYGEGGVSALRADPSAPSGPPSSEEAPLAQGSPAGRAALVVLLLGSTLVVMAGAVLSPVLALLRADLALTSTAAGLVLTVHALVIAVASPGIGWLVDRYGPRGPLAAGLVVYGLAGGAGLLTTSYPTLLASRVVFGLGAAAVFTGTTVALLAQFQGTQQDRVMGWRSTATSLGGVAWPLIGGALGTVSWHAPFAVYLLGVPLGAATLLVLRRGRAAPDRSESGAEDEGGLLRLLQRRPRILGQYGLLATGTVLLYALVAFLPLRLAELDVRSPLLVAVLTISMSVAMSIAGLAYATVVARLGSLRLLRGVYLAFTAAFALLAATDELVLMVAAQALFGAGMGLAIPALTVMLSKASPPRLRGAVMALSATAIFLGQFLAPVLLGPLADATSLTTSFAAAAVLAAGVLAALFTTTLRGPADHPDPAVPSRTGDRR